jgi:hypothetical protein
MTGIVWILVGGMTGWLTGTFMGEQGYGKSLLGVHARSLDIVLASWAPFLEVIYFSGLSSGKPAPLAYMLPRSLAR